jgi:hypothetical protein
LRSTTGAVQVDADAGERAALRHAVGLDQVRFGAVSRDRCERRLALQRRREPRNRTAFLVGGDEKRREALIASDRLPTGYLPCNVFGRESFDIARRNEHSGDGAPR